jgi:hypothetical protein
MLTAANIAHREQKQSQHADCRKQRANIPHREQEQSELVYCE